MFYGCLHVKGAGPLLKFGFVDGVETRVVGGGGEGGGIEMVGVCCVGGVRVNNKDDSTPRKNPTGWKIR